MNACASGVTVTPDCAVVGKKVKRDIQSTSGRMVRIVAHTGSRSLNLLGDKAAEFVPLLYSSLLFAIIR